MMNNNMQNNNIANSSSQSDLKKKFDAIPDKMGFKIGEVAEFVGVKQYVLRYWETEFEALHPRKSHNGQRFYTRKDIEMALMIRKLLHEDRFSIEGARAVLKKMKQAAKSQTAVAVAPIQEGTTQEQVIEAHQPANEVVLNKSAKAQPAMQANNVVQVEKALQQRDKELRQYWSSSLDYLLEEIRQSRRRLLEG